MDVYILTYACAHKEYLVPLRLLSVHAVYILPNCTIRMLYLQC